MTRIAPIAARVADRSRRARVGEFLIFVASSASYQASRLGVTLVAAAVVAPVAFGVWGVATVILTYSTHATIGVLSGANRRIPILLGRGTPSEAVAVEQAAFGGAAACGIALALATAAWGWAIGGEWATVGLLLGIAAGAQQFYLLGQVVLRGRLEFNRASVQQFTLAILFPLAGLPGLAVAGVEGLIAGQAFAYAAGAMLVWRWRADLRPALDAPRLRSLVVEGAPIMLSGLIVAGMTSVDRWVVLSWSGREALGQYSLAATLASAILFISLVVAQQFYPAMAQRYGAGTDSRALLSMARRQGLTAVVLAAPIAALLAVAAPMVIAQLYASYAASIGALQVLSLAYVALAFTSGYTNLLLTLGRAWQLVVVQGVVAGLAAVLSSIALLTGLGLVGVAWAMLGAFLTLGVSIIVLARRAADG